MKIFAYSCRNARTHVNREILSSDTDATTKSYVFLVEARIKSRIQDCGSLTASSTRRNEKLGAADIRLRVVVARICEDVSYSLSEYETLQTANNGS